MTELARRPTTIAGGGAVGAALLATGAAVGSPIGLGLGVLGTALLGAGLVRGSGIALEVGPFLLFAAALHTAVVRGSPGLALLGAVGAVLAWDLGRTALTVGRQLGREADTVRLEVARILASLVVAVVSATIGYAIFALVGVGESHAALAALALAVFFATVALGTGNRRVRPAEG